MGDSREDSPDWLRSFQAPTRSITILLSDSEGSGDKSPSRDYSDDDDDDDDKMISDLKSTRKQTTKKRKTAVDEIPAKSRKTKKDKEEESEAENDDEKGDFMSSTRNHSVLALSSDSESDINAAIREEAIEESSAHVLSEVMTKENLDDDDETAAPNAVVKGISPKKQRKQANVKPKEKKTTNKPVKIDDTAMREKDAAEVVPADHELSDSIKEEGNNDNESSASKVVVKRKSPKKRIKENEAEPTETLEANEPLKLEGDVADERLPEKHVEPRVSSSTLPLVLPEKVSRSKALVECEGDSIDLSGDMGAVGRVIISDTPCGEHEMLLDLKGTIYKTTIVPSRTFCVVSIGQSEAKIEAIMNDFIQLKPQSNVYGAETMVEGTLEGFSFDSEDEADKMNKDVEVGENEGAEKQTGKKPRGKAEKKSGAAQKKGKAAGGKQPMKRKPQASKKGEAKM